MYKQLLSTDYSEAVNLLLSKYGHGKDDYYRENSYKRFLSGEIKNITRGKYSRTNEGLYCHHIDEINMMNISNKDFIKENKLSYVYQKKERLVYCDLIEHTILHVLIAKETSGDFGFLGYEVFLKPIIEEWYIEEKIPNPLWMKNCYSKAFVNPEEAVQIIGIMQKLLGLCYVGSSKEYYDEKARKLQRIKDNQIQRERKQKELEIQWRKKEEERKRKEFNKKLEEFYIVYPSFEEVAIHFGTPRKRVLSMMFDYKYNNHYKTNKDFNKAMLPVIKDELLRELYTMISK